LLGAAFDGGLPDGATRALGMIFAAPGDRAAAVAIVDRELRRIGAAAIEWRVVPIRRDHVLPAQRGTTPEILQVAAAFGARARVVDGRLYRARLRIERAARRSGAALDVISLSTKTVVYKALVTPEALERFYPDLAAPAYV